MALSALLAGCFGAPPSGPLVEDSPTPEVSESSPPPAATQAPLPTQAPENPPLAVAALSSDRIHMDANGTFWVGANKTVAFDASMSQGRNLTYRWDFGDAMTGHTQYVTHVYLETGQYVGRLEVTDAAARSSFVELHLGILPYPWGSPPPLQITGTIRLGNPLSRNVGGVTELDCGHTPQLQGVDGHVAALNETFWGGRYATTLQRGETGIEVLSVWYYDRECKLLSNSGKLSGFVPHHSAWVVIDLELGAGATFEYTAYPRGV